MTSSCVVSAIARDIAAWQQGPVEFPNDEDDGSGWQLPTITITPDDFIAYAKNYYQEDFAHRSPAQVHQVFKQYA